MADELLNLIKEQEQQDYFTRMDEHKALYALEKYQMKIGDKVIPDIINQTLPDPQTYADYIISTCANEVQQIEVIGDKLLTGQAEKIEEILNAIDEAVEERLTNMEYPGLKEFDFSMACLRGRVGRRILLRVEGDKFIPDILPLDPRYLTYEVTDSGLDWASYKINKTPKQMKALYPKFNISKLPGVANDGSKELEFRDAWKKDRHYIYVNDDLVHEEPNIYKYVPFVIKVCNTGNSLLDKDMRKYKGNSVYASVADLYPELNRVVSILATLNVRTIQGNLQYKSVLGQQAEKPEEPPFGFRQVFPVEQDGGYYAMPLEDIREATQMLWNILEQRKQEATIASTKYGNLDFPLSAVALAKLGSETDKILFPRIEVVAKLNISSARMVIEQLKAIGGTIDIGEIGSYDTSVLKGKFNIKYTYTQTSAEQDISNISIANAAKEHYSQDTIMRDILKVRDPAKEASKKRIDKFEAIGANNMTESELKQVVYDLRDADRHIEARFALDALKDRIRARKMQAMNPQMNMGEVKTPTPTGQSNSGENILPLTEESGTRKKVQAETLTKV